MLTVRDRYIARTDLVDGQWPFIGLSHELAILTGLISDPTVRGVVLAGAAGVGKTRLADECLAVAHASPHFFVVRTSGHRSSSELPFGALAHLLPTVDHGDETMRQDRFGLLQQFTMALTALAGNRRLLLLVDDAHLLDRGSAALIYQLAHSGSAFVLATVQAGVLAPDAVVALWKDGLLARHEVSGLPVELTEKLVGSTLGGVVDPMTALVFANHCRGNVLFLRELVLGALADQTLRYELGMWRLVRALQPSSRLVELVEARLSILEPKERDLMERVSLGEPLALENVGDALIVERLERAGLVTAVTHRGSLRIRLGHPVYGDVLRARMPALRVAVPASVKVRARHPCVPSRCARASPQPNTKQQSWPPAAARIKPSPPNSLCPCAP